MEEKDGPWKLTLITMNPYEEEAPPQNLSSLSHPSLF